jgi:1-acyl-sn-glycerol-3-phosphate acyltransferase
MTALFYWFITITVRYIVLPLYASLEVKGAENVPRKGPLIVASNHLNDADPGVLSTRIPRRLVFMTKDELFHVPGLAQFLRAYGAFPIRRHEVDISAIRRSNETLKHGLALLLFPEGTRSAKDARLGKAWPGTAMIALRNGVPILPVAITGSQEMALPGLFLGFFKRKRITLTIGKPFFLAVPERVNSESAAIGTRLIMEEIAALLPESYRGYYGEQTLDRPDGDVDGPGTKTAVSHPSRA